MRESRLGLVNHFERVLRPISSGGLYLVRVLSRACAEWPRASVPGDFHELVRSSASVLTLSGTLDPATPAHFARDAVRSLPSSRQVLVPNVAHDYFPPCLRDIIVHRGLRRARIGGELDSACIGDLRRPRFVTERWPRAPRLARTS